MRVVHSVRGAKQERPVRGLTRTKIPRPTTTRPGEPPRPGATQLGRAANPDVRRRERRRRRRREGPEPVGPTRAPGARERAAGGSGRGGAARKGKIWRRAAGGGRWEAGVGHVDRRAGPRVPHRLRRLGGSTRRPRPPTRARGAASVTSAPAAADGTRDAWRRRGRPLSRDRGLAGGANRGGRVPSRGARAWGREPAAPRARPPTVPAAGASDSRRERQSPPAPGVRAGRTGGANRAAGGPGARATYAAPGSRARCT